MQGVCMAAILFVATLRSGSAETVDYHKELEAEASCKLPVAWLDALVLAADGAEVRGVERGAGQIKEGGVRCVAYVRLELEREVKSRGFTNVEGSPQP